MFDGSLNPFLFVFHAKHNYHCKMILSAPKALTADDRIPFGPYKGERMEDVPVGFLHWLFTKKEFDRKSPVGLYIQNNLSALETENTDLIWPRP